MQDISSMLNISVGDHLCCLYRTEDEHRAILMPFIENGLQQGDKTIYIVDAHTAETVLDYLDQTGLDVRLILDQGRLVLLNSRQTYVLQGEFDPGSMLSLLQRETEKALEEGFRALRVTGEMSWALRGTPGSERLMEYEAKLNRFFPQNRAIGLCQYDMRSFAPEVLLDVLATHPIAIVGSQCYDNIYYVSPEEFLGGNRAQAELSSRLRNLEERRQNDNERMQLEKELRKREDRARREMEFTKAILDTAGALIVVLDKEGRIVRFNRTCEQLSGYQAHEVLGRDIRSVLFPEEDSQSDREIFQELCAGQFPERFENEWLTKDGSRIRVSWSNTCLRDEQDALDLVICTGLDITELSLLENARERELNSLRDYSESKGSSMTASSLGITGLGKTHPAEFQQYVRELRKLMERAVEQNIYKVQHNLSQDLRRLAESLGRMHAGPKDLIQVYIQARQEKVQGLTDKMNKVFTDEGRLLLIELMGYLAAYYYHNCLVRAE